MLARDAFSTACEDADTEAALVSELERLRHKLRLSGAAAQSTEDGNRMKLLDEKLIPSQVKELEAMRLASVRVGSRADG